MDKLSHRSGGIILGLNIFYNVNELLTPTVAIHPGMGDVHDVAVGDGKIEPRVVVEVEEDHAESHKRPATRPSTQWLETGPIHTVHRDTLCERLMLPQQHDTHEYELRAETIAHAAFEQVDRH